MLELLSTSVVVSFILFLAVPFSRPIWTLLKATSRDMLYVGKFFYRVLSESAPGFNNWMVSIGLFLGFILSVWVIKKLVDKPTVGRLAHE